MILELAATVAILMGQSIGTNEPVDYRETAGVYVKQEVGAGFHGWASAEYGQGYLVGQSVSDFLAGSVGLGYGYSITDRVKLSAEAGVGYPLSRNDYSIQQEVAFTYLVDRHAVDPSRPIPVEVRYPYDQESYETTLHYDYGAVLRLGVEFEATENLRVFVFYKYFHPKTLIEIYDQENKDAGLGWWQEYRSTDMSTVQLGIGWEF